MKEPLEPPELLNALRQAATIYRLNLSQVGRSKRLLEDSTGIIGLVQRDRASARIGLGDSSNKSRKEE